MTDKPEKSVLYLKNDEESLRLYRESPNGQKIGSNDERNIRTLPVVEGYYEDFEPSVPKKYTTRNN